MEIVNLDDVKVDDVETPDNIVEGLKTPTIGMYFETIEEARNYYERYGRENGFRIRTRASSKGRNQSNEVTKVLFVCAKEGKYVAKNQKEGVVEGNDEIGAEEKVIPKKRVRRSTTKCECKAHLRIMHEKWNCKWKVTGFDENHNHQLVTPCKRIKMMSNRNMPKAVKSLTEALHKENIESSKVPSIFGGEYIGFDNRDCYSHLRNVRHRDLDCGDAQSVLDYFKNKQAHNPQFFYAIQCDEVYYKRSKFKKDMKKCIKGTYKKEDFEERWMLLMKENGLESNEWLQGVFDIRESWVPVYNRDTFFAGMNTTEHNKGINSFFDGFVAHTSNLTEVVVKYEKALKRIVKRENDEDFESEHKFQIVNDHEFLLKHAAKVYTRNVFNKFKDEWSKVFYYKVENVRSANGFQYFVVKSKDDELEKFEVTLDSQTYEGKCECQQFEFVGILCAHILKVFVRLDIDEIPEHFILPRWRQKANKFRIIDSLGLVHDDGKEESEALRLGHMCHEATKLACLAASSNEEYTTFIEAINVLFEKIQEVSMVSPIEGCQGKSRNYPVQKIEKRY
ncbi:hypothetical protein RHSIM_Rhsim10G0083300 [Rhododendron simsii]|uniref:Protein FAR1-RELATED SEQUENCE n=1 Tax=Rhododendron simsii TaxID=118357 RepID=A0A834LBZ5_RHOSS|nr:hypothetical protein RHSIM_Rhsim10G0083300 [Rhododendron simsii]